MTDNFSHHAHVTNENTTTTHQDFKEEDLGEAKTTLVSRNITIMGRRTSIRLEPEMWVSLKDIAGREDCSIHDICTLVSLRKKPKTSLTAAIRVFLMLYYRAAATEDGHIRAGHGDFENMVRRARLCEELIPFKADQRRGRLSSKGRNQINPTHMYN